MLHAGLMGYIPTLVDDLAHYVSASSPAPFVWVPAPEEIEGTELLYHAMRDPSIPGHAGNPYPMPLAEDAGELQRGLDSDAVAALLAAYSQWVAAVRPSGDPELARLMALLAVPVGPPGDPMSDEQCTALVERWRYRHAVELAACYGRPSTALSIAEITRWAIMCGLLAAPLSAPAPQRGAAVGRLGAYVLRLRAQGDRA